jgi:anti-anti-sigma factor
VTLIAEGLVPSRSSAGGPPLTALIRLDRLATTVVLRGEVDLSTRSLLSDTLSRVVAFCDVNVIVDFAGVSFIDSGSIEVLAVAQQLLARDGRQLTIRSASPIAMRALTVLGLGALVETPDGGLR